MSKEDWQFFIVTLCGMALGVLGLIVCHQLEELEMKAIEYGHATYIDGRFTWKAEVEP